MDAEATDEFPCDNTQVDCDRYEPGVLRQIVYEIPEGRYAFWLVGGLCVGWFYPMALNVPKTDLLRYVYFDHYQTRLGKKGWQLRILWFVFGRLS